MQKTALIIDHDDSFIWNIKFWLQPEFEVSMTNHSEQLTADVLNKYDLIVLSPGPKSPENYPQSLKLLHSNLNTPILGICLGLQMMTVSEGGLVAAYTPPLHGKTSKLNVNGLKVARYHSLRCQPTDHFEIKATSLDDQSVMWMQHKTKKQMGFQFHPESFLTESSAIYKQHVIDWMQSC